MRIIACLAWWNETPETLTRCVSSLKGFCTDLVAFDGRWLGVGDAQAEHEWMDEVRAIGNTATAAGLHYEIHHAEDDWGSQVEKRAALMEAADALGGRTDWLFVIDADEWITEIDANAARFALADTFDHVARVAQRVQPVRTSTFVRPRTRLFRSGLGVTVRHGHNGYVTADGRWLYGDPRHVTLEPAADLTGCVLLGHDAEARPSEREAARRAYLSFRHTTAAERWPETQAVPA